MDFDDLDQLLDLEEDLLFEDDDTGCSSLCWRDAAHTIALLRLCMTREAGACRRQEEELSGRRVLPGGCQKPG
jgi:hypothetical protein